jgi:hypothetical protein
MYSFTQILLYIWLQLYMNILGLWKVVQEQLYDRHRKPKGMCRRKCTLSSSLTFVMT